MRPFVSAVIGLGAGGIGTQQQSGNFLDAGGGVRIPVTDGWGVRSDARLTHRAGSKDPSQWRIYNGATFKVRGR